MSLQISYMGTKRQIAPVVADIVSSAPGGPLLELFSGICAVSSAIGVERPVWCNDIQHFAFNVASAFFTSLDGPPAPLEAAKLVGTHYQANKESLSEKFCQLLKQEVEALASADEQIVSKFYKMIPHVGASPKLEEDRITLAANPRQEPYQLFSITFAGGYLGLTQAIQTDSLRFAIDRAKSDGAVTDEQHRWMLLALCEAVCKVATTTGHFAQFMTAKRNNVSKYIAQRQRSVYREWLYALETNVPMGSKRWRRQNIATRCDALELVKNIKENGSIPSIIYADPPYTKDQYSRYYHLYETLILYDYPRSQAIGRYRPDRFQSQFSMRTAVVQAFETLLKSCASLGCELVLSYPDNGLLPGARETVHSMLKRHFRRTEIAMLLGHRHSSLGASSGHEKRPATEILFWAR